MNTTITTTLRVEEVAAIKKTGLKYNHLIRVGLQAVSGNIQEQNNKRFEELEATVDRYKKSYFEVKRSLLEMQEEKEKGVANVE